MFWAGHPFENVMSTMALFPSKISLCSCKTACNSQVPTANLPIDLPKRSTTPVKAPDEFIPQRLFYSDVSYMLHLSL